ncbi:protein ALP1-like [Amphibalanus amphitrite]|uniref:protein ALP1-like n=1 Tax=Amphibalanus amphitrite TaxID=1232801 RepID=UPI001C902955|nr:protein ALP1-like [Amphibalanus amphitrite]
MEYDEECRPKRRHKSWVADVNRRRRARGEFFNLVQELRTNDPERHRTYFRMTRDTFDLLLSKIGPTIARKHTNFRELIDPAQRLAVTLRYLASGMEFSALAPTYRLGEKTVRAIVYDTCAAIITAVGPEVLASPTRHTWERSEATFRDRWNFPNCVAALDGKHVVLQAPANTGSEYFNYKHTFSTVLLAAVDGDYRFVYVSVGSAGRESDGGVFRRSDLAAALRDDSLQLPPPKALPGTNTIMPHVIVADEAFPLTTAIMRPYPGRTEARLGVRATVFNYRLSRARRIVENAFGILAQTWRIYRRPMNVNVQHACKIVHATCILHNFLHADEVVALQGRPELDQQDRATAPAGLADALHRLGANNYTRAAEHVRDQFARYFAGEGAVPWQMEHAV